MKRFRSVSGEEKEALLSLKLVLVSLKNKKPITHADSYPFTLESHLLSILSDTHAQTHAGSKLGEMRRHSPLAAPSLSLLEHR